MSAQQETANTPLIAYATSKRGRDGISSWIVAACPYCGKRHMHGGGDGNSPAHLGHRVAHCSDESGPGYTLVDATKRNELHTDATPKWSNRGHWILTVVECPFCNGTHDHQAGSNDNSPNWGQRHRAPCCGESYIVNEV